MIFISRRETTAAFCPGFPKTIFGNIANVKTQHMPIKMMIPFGRNTFSKVMAPRRVLKHLTKGDCVFLTPTGCKLEIGIRPLVCRLFPHTYTGSRHHRAWDSECLAAIHSPSYLVATSIAGVSMPEAQQWHQMLYQEIVWEGII